MQKKIIALLLLFAMIFTLSMPVMAVDFIAVRLNQADKGQTPITASGPIPDDLNNNPSFVDGASTSGTSYAFWCFIANSGPSDHAVITFLLPDGTNKAVTFNPSVKNTQNDHYNIITPVDYKVLDGYCYYPNSGSNQVFTLSHSYAYQQSGSLKVTANVVKQHEKNIYQPIWQKEIQPIWQKEIQPVWQKEIQPIWQREVQPVRQREIQPIRQRELQPYNVPTFIKEISSASQSTLVTRLSYSNNTTRAVPTNGGAFKNGHTYVKLDVEAATKPGGVWYTIADSSLNNGKKTPDKYNIPIDYQYNVQITNGKLTISLDDRLVSASVGAYVVNDVKNFPGNAPPHYSNTVTVNMPQNSGAYVYLYVHFEGGIQWYTTGQYQFVGWKYDHTDIAKDYWVRDDVAKDYWVRDDIANHYWVRDDIANHYWVRDDVANNYWVRNDIANDYRVRDEFVISETVTDPYNAMFNLVVTNNANGQIVYNGQLANLGEVVIPNLSSGEYTATLNGGDIATQTKTVTVTVPNQVVIAFDDVPAVIGAVENVYLPKIYLDDIILDKIYLNEIVLDKIYLDDIILDKTYLDDIILDNTYLDDVILDETYLQDIEYAAINLGDETDPFGPYAIRLN